MTGLLLCGGTGRLGGAIAVRLARRQVPFRALVRSGSDAGPLRALGADLRVGDLTDPPSLERAMTGATTVVTTANAITRMLAGARDLSIDGVDKFGNEALIRAAASAGVQRFVFVSLAGLTPGMVGRSPFAAAKLAAERVLQAAPMRSVIVRPAPFQELWLSPSTGMHPARRRAVIFGRGRAPASYVAVDDVAEACVRLALADDPPASIDIGGPEALTRHQVVDAFERAMGVRFRRTTVPRPLLAAGVRVLRGRKPEVASVMGMSLTLDLEGCDVSPQPLRDLGVEPRTVVDLIDELSRESAARR